MTQCNWCRLADLRQKARRYQRKLTVLPATDESIDVFMHPQGMRPPAGFTHQSGSKDGFDQFWVTSLTAVPERCEC